MTIPVFITYRDRISMLERAIAALFAHGFDDITVIDNDSIVPVESDAVRVLRADNAFRHLAPWKYDLVPSRDFYIVMDCDVELDCPLDVGDYLVRTLRASPGLPKLGLGIRTDDLLDPPPAHLAENYRTEDFVERCPIRGGLRLAPVDTHFALYPPGTPDFPGINGARTLAPYLCRLLGWYNESWSSEELVYYRHSPEWARSHRAESALL